MPQSVYDPERYLKHFFLIAEPFSLTPDPEFLYLSESHADALAAIELGVMEKRGLTVLTGEVGTGKTTLAHSVLAQWRQHLHTAYLRTGTFTFDDILRKSLQQFGLPNDGPVENCLDRLGDFLFAEAKAGKTVVLIIDEAQNLPPEAFEQLRLLLNFETEKQKLLQMVLLGQPELERRLESHQLRHIEGRVAVRTRLEPLPPQDCELYVEHRLNVAGATTEVFTQQALKAIVKASGGIPRRLNVLCHNALLFAYGRDQQRVDGTTAGHAIRHSGGTGLLGGGGGVPNWLKAAAAVLAIVVVVTLLNGLRGRSNVESAEPSVEQLVVEIPDMASPGPPQLEGNASEVLESPEDADAQAGEPQAQPTLPPGLSPNGDVLVLREGQSLSRQVFKLYGRFDSNLLKAFSNANPEIEDLDSIEPGVPIKVPGSLVR